MHLRLSINLDEYRARACQVAQRLDRINTALDADRLRHVRTCRVEPYDGDGLSAKLISLLQQVSPHLTRLAIIPLPTCDDSTNELSHHEFFGGLDSARINFPELVHFKYAFGQDAGLMGDQYGVNLENAGATLGSDGG